MQLRKQARRLTKSTRTREPEHQVPVKIRPAWKNTLGQTWQDAELTKGRLTPAQTPNYV